MFYSKRIQSLGTETAFEVLARAKALESQGKEIIHLEIGEPDFDTPKNIRERAKKALDELERTTEKTSGPPASS